MPGRALQICAVDLRLCDVGQLTHSVCFMAPKQFIRTVFCNSPRPILFGDMETRQWRSLQTVDEQNQRTRASPQYGEESRSGGSEESSSSDEQSSTPRSVSRLVGHAEKAMNEWIKQHYYRLAHGLHVG